MNPDSTNLVAPLFGQQFPIYPALPQLVVVNGSAITGNYYAGFNNQYASSALRTREACYILDANGGGLADGQYCIGRLIGSYTSSGLALPLYAVGEVAGSSGTAPYDFNSYRSPSNFADVVFGYSPGFVFGNYAKTTTPTPNMVYAFPVLFPAGYILQSLTNPVGIWLDTAGYTGALCRIAFYRNSGGIGGASTVGGVLFPGQDSVSGYLVWDSGDMALDSTAVVDQGPPGFVYVTTGSDIVFAPGMYWMCIQFNNVFPMPIVGGASTDNMQSVFGAGTATSGGSATGGVAWGGSVMFGYAVPQTYAAYVTTGGPFPVADALNIITGSQDVPLPIFWNAA